MSGLESKTQLIPADGTFRVPVTGNFLMLIATGAPVTVRMQRATKVETFANVQGGLSVQRIQTWERCSITGTPGTSVEWFAGDCEVREDKTEYARTVGVFQQQLPASIGDADDVVVAPGAAATEVAPALEGRARITVMNLDTSTVAIRVGGATVTATRGLRLARGQSQTFEGEGAIYAVQESAGVASVCMNWEAM